MDYRKLAEKLLSIQAELHLVSIDRQMSKFSQGMFFALQLLNAHSGAINPRDLSQGMSVSSARVAALLNRMEAQGLVRREPDTTDNRQVVIFVTEKGARLLRAMREDLLGDIARALETIGPEDAATYLRIQRKMLDALTLQEKSAAHTGGAARKDARALV